MRAVLLLAAALAFAQPNPRVGFYQWESTSVIPSLLIAGRERIEATGAGLMRIYLGPRFDYVQPVLAPFRFDGANPCTPARILRISHYRGLLEAPALPTLVFTVYPSRDYGGGCDDINLLRPWSRQDQEAEYAQMFELSEFLLRDYGHLNKTVILANTEADNRMLDVMNHTGSPELAVANLRAWQNTRYQAVDDARRRYPKARLKLLNAFEISLVNMGVEQQGHRFVKTPRGRWNVFRDVVPQVNFDLLSYSAYESTNAPYETGAIDTPARDTGKRLARDLRQLAAATRKPTMIGELGIPREVYDRLPSGGVAARLASAFQAIREVRPAYVVFWQVFDAPQGRREPVEFGWLDPQRQPPKVLLDFIRSWR